MFPGFRYLTWLTALGLAFFFSNGLAVFGLMVEPEETGNPVGLFIFGLILSLTAQLGLLLTPLALSQGIGIRVAVAAVMAPPAVFLGFVALEAIERLTMGRPLSTLTIASLIGAGVYIAAYVELIRKSPPWGRRPIAL